jgi:hypothetical protein
MTPILADIAPAFIPGRSRGSLLSIPTTDQTVVDLLVGDRVMTGFFDNAKGRWMVNGGKTPIPEGLYPSHWRKLTILTGPA